MAKWSGRRTAPDTRNRAEPKKEAGNGKAAENTVGEEDLRDSWQGAQDSWIPCFSKIQGQMMRFRWRSGETARRWWTGSTAKQVLVPQLSI